MVCRDMLRKIVPTGFVLYLLLFCEITSSKRLHSPGLDGPKSKKLNKCGRCKVLTDSFNYWLEKTSRGKWEGGDAAWEASKLKSYSRSEIRLVEIQESLCSELNKYQDYCYILSEEAEQVLEQWWFGEDLNSADLYSWLCIETLKYCCPDYHFGEFCTSCPLDKDNKVCSGHGKCDGDGTREGNGTCICKRGYSGKSCKDCVENYFPASDGSCKQCHKACSSCLGEGPSECQSCKPGWELKSGVCVDIDECLSSTSCNPNENCINKEGIFECKPCDASCKTCAGIGAKNCTSCEPNYALWGGMCITEDQRDDILFDTIARLLLYIGIIFIIFKNPFHLTYNMFNFKHNLFMVLIAVSLYYIETKSSTNLIDVVINVYKSFEQKAAFSYVINRISKVCRHKLNIFNI